MTKAGMIFEFVEVRQHHEYLKYRSSNIHLNKGTEFESLGY